VPLVFRYPGRVPSGVVVEHAVSTVGTFATLAELAGVEVPPTVQVPSLLAAVPDLGRCADADEPDICEDAERQRAETVGQPVIAERFEKHVLSSRFREGQANGEGALVNPRGRYRTFREGPYKLVQHDQGGTFLFHLELGEHQDLAPIQPSTREELERSLTEWILALELPSLGAEVAQIDVAEKTPEDKCSLCALGYLHGPDCEGC